MIALPPDVIVVVFSSRRNVPTSARRDRACSTPRLIAAGLIATSSHVCREDARRLPFYVAHLYYRRDRHCWTILSDPQRFSMWCHATADRYEYAMFVARRRAGDQRACY